MQFVTQKEISVENTQLDKETEAHIHLPQSDLSGEVLMCGISLYYDQTNRFTDLTCSFLMHNLDSTGVGAALPQDSQLVSWSASSCDKPVYSYTKPIGRLFEYDRVKYLITPDTDKFIRFYLVRVPFTVPGYSLLRVKAVRLLIPTVIDLQEPLQFTYQTLFDRH